MLTLLVARIGRACSKIRAIKLKGKPYCPVKALLQYLPLRNSRFQDNNISNRMPLFMAQYLWKAGAARPDFSQPGFYTKPRFAKDTDDSVEAPDGALLSGWGITN